MKLKISLSFALLALLAGGCSKTECGPGTIEVDGACVPTMDACGAGTLLVDGKCEPTAVLECGPFTTEEDGKCVPDGSQVCTGNTVFDAATMACVVDPSACGAGTVFSEEAQTCVDPSSLLEASINELPGPNDPLIDGADAMAQTFDFPELDETVVLGGCATPVDVDEDGVADPDLDAFSFEISEPTYINLRLDGVNGLSPGALIAQTDIEGRITWLRGVVDLSNDNVESKVYLPTAGTYLMILGESSNVAFATEFVLTQSASGALRSVGGMEACYFAQITPEAMPAPTPVTVDTPVTGVLGDPQFYSISPEDSVYIVSLMNENQQHLAGTNITQAGQIQASAYQDGTSLVAFSGTQTVGEDLLIVVDTFLDLSVDEATFDFSVLQRARQEYPADGPVTITPDPEGQFFDGFLYFDATEGDVVNLEFISGTMEEYSAFLLIDNGLVSLCSDCSDFNSWYVAKETSRVAIRVLLPDTATEPVTVAMKRTAVTPEVLTPGAAPSMANFADLSRAFFRLDASALDWVDYQASGFAVPTDVEFFEDTEAGVIDGDGFTGILRPVDSEITDASFQRIYAGTSEPLLVSIGSDAGATAQLAVENVTYTDLGGVTEAMSPLARMGEMSPGLYLARGTAGTALNISATGMGAANISITELDDEAMPANLIDDTTMGSELFSYTFGASPEFVAFRVDDVVEAGATFDLNIIIEDPYIYGSSIGALPFTEICPALGGTGERHALETDDITMEESLEDALSAAPVVFATLPAPFNFNFYGEEAKGFVVSSNGRIIFDIDWEGSDTTRQNAAMPFGGLFMVLDETNSVCTKHDPAMNTYTVEWNGDAGFFDAGGVVQTQVVLHADGHMDFLYGPNHTADSTAIVTIGVQEDTSATATLIDTDMTPIGAGQSITLSVP